MKSRKTGRHVLIRGFAVLLLIGGLVASLVRPAAAQVDGTEYESPQFDLTLSWSGPWELSQGSVKSTRGVLDQISLESPGGFLQLILIVPTEDDPQVYLDVLLQNLEESGTAYEEIGSDSGDDYLSTTVDFTIESQGQELQLREYVEVSTLETIDGDPALFTGSLLANVDDFENQWESLLESVERDGRDPVFHGVPEGIGGSNRQPTPTGNSSNKGGIDGNTYVGPQYGFSVEWDDDLWEAEDISDKAGDALVLNGDSSQVQIRSYDEPDASARDCVSEAADLAEANDGVTNFGRTSDYDRPKAGEDGFGRLYAFDYEPDGQRSTAFLQYIECRPMGDAEGVYLVITLLTTERSYEDELPGYEDLVSTIELGQGGGTDLTTGIGRQGGNDKKTPTSGSGNEPVLKSASYTGGAYGYRIVWDKAVWQAEALEPDDGYEGVKLVSDGSSAYIEAIEAYGGDPEECATQTGEQLNTFDGVSDARKERRPTLPETNESAVATIYSYTYTPEDENDDPLDFVEYIECRELVAGSVVLRVTIISLFDNYEDLVPEWEAMIAGIKINGSSSNSGSSGKAEVTPPAGGGDDAFPGVAGRKYTSPQFGFTLGWDSSWTVVNATSEEGGTTLTLDNGVSIVLVFGGAFALDPARCVADLADVAGAAQGVSNFNVVTNNDGAAQAGGDDTFGWGLFSLTRGGADYFDYIYCQPATTGEYVVAIVYQMPVAEFATELTTLEALLATLTVD